MRNPAARSRADLGGQPLPGQDLPRPRQRAVDVGLEVMLADQLNEASRVEAAETRRQMKRAASLPQAADAAGGRIRGLHSSVPTDNRLDI